MAKRKKKIQRPTSQQPRSSVSLRKVTLHKLTWLERISIGLSVWFLFYPKPYTILFTVLLALPIIGLILNGLHRPSIVSLVEITKDKDGDDKYDVADFIDLPACIILLRVLLDYEFESFYSILAIGTVGFVIVLIILFATHKLIEASVKSRTWIYLSVLFSVMIYSYAGTYGINCVYDNSEPETYVTEVLDKRISRGKRHTTYYIKVAPWGHHHDKEDISVPSEQYAETSIGDRVNVDYKKGLLGIPWYYIRSK